MSYLYNGAREYIEKMKNDNSGVAVVEVILILVVLIGLVFIFKEQASQSIINVTSELHDTTRNTLYKCCNIYNSLINPRLSILDKLICIKEISQSRENSTILISRFLFSFIS